MDIKLIICDLDGTLLRGDKTVSAYTLDVLHRCRAAGIKLGIATARSRHGARVFTDLMAPDVLIYDGGAVATIGDEVVFRRTIDAQTAAALSQRIAQSADYTAAECDGAYFYSGESPTPYAQEIVAHGHMVVATDFAEALPANAHKISGFMRDFDADTILKDFQDIGMTRYHGENLVRFAHVSATKWQALTAVVAHFDLNPSQIAAFGDDYNDVEMLANVGIGVAMENAIAKAKAAAKHICGDNNSDGVARWIEENIL